MRISLFFAGYVVVVLIVLSRRSIRSLGFAGHGLEWSAANLRLKECREKDGRR